VYQKSMLELFGEEFAIGSVISVQKAVKVFSLGIFVFQSQSSLALASALFGLQG
jgi:hypothetical protein